MNPGLQTAEPQDSALPGLVIHLQQFRGTGHRFRMMRLAEVLARDFRVCLLDGGPPEPQLPRPVGVELTPLEPLFRDACGVVRPWSESLALGDALQRRRAKALDAIQRRRPQVLIVEFYPFSRLNLAEEIECLIRDVRFYTPSALVLSSVRDIPATGFDDGVPAKESSPEAIAKRLAVFDGLLIHADPNRTLTLDDFPGARESGIPVHFTGPIGPSDVRSAPPTRQGTVLSMGGGVDGLPLALAALSAWGSAAGHGELARLEPLRVFLGPYLPEGDREILWQACESAGVACLPFVNNFTSVLAESALSISRFGYNTCMDILASGVPAIVVPAPTAPANDQMARAHDLERQGRVVMAQDSPASILEAMKRIARQTTSYPTASMPGAERAARWILQQQKPNRDGACPGSGGAGTGWFAHP